MSAITETEVAAESATIEADAGLTHENPPHQGSNGHTEEEPVPEPMDCPDTSTTASIHGRAELMPQQDKNNNPRGLVIFGLQIFNRKDNGEKERQIITSPPSPISPVGLSAPPASPTPPKKPGFLRRHALFIFTVVIPTLLAAAYYGSYASNIYISESSYVVRSPNQKSAASGLGAMLEGAGFSGFTKAPDDVYTVSKYVRSRDALDFLQTKLDLKSAWQNEHIDLLHRFDPLDWDGSQEALYEYYLKRVSVMVDPASGITTLNVSAFDPETAHKINQMLLGEAERLVNILNERGRNDLIRFADSEVRAAEEKAKAAAKALSDFRNQEAVVDPERQTQMHYEQVSRLQEELVKTQAQLTQLRVFAPDSPHPPALELRIQTLQNEIAKETEKITGGEESLASKAAEFERLALDREFADKQLASALASLEVARNEAQRQQLYLETIAKPNLPDEAKLPKRLRGIVTTFILGLVAWGILAMLLAGVREHQY